MSTLGKEHVKANLTRLFPFLNSSFRIINKDEINSKKVLSEIFGDTETDMIKLYAIYKFQQCDTKTKTI